MRRLFNNRVLKLLVAVLLLTTVIIVLVVTHKPAVEENPIKSLADIYGWVRAEQILEEYARTSSPFPRNYDVVSNDDVFWFETIEFDEQAQCYRANFKISTTSITIYKGNPEFYLNVWIDDAWYPCPIEQIYQSHDAYYATEIYYGLNIDVSWLMQHKKDGEMVAFPPGRYRAAKLLHVSDDKSTGIGTGNIYITVEFTISER